MVFHIFPYLFYHGFFMGDCSKFCVKKNEIHRTTLSCSWDTRPGGGRLIERRMTRTCAWCWAHFRDVAVRPGGGGGGDSGDGKDYYCLTDFKSAIFGRLSWKSKLIWKVAWWARVSCRRSKMYGIQCKLVQFCPVIPHSTVFFSFSLLFFYIQTHLHWFCGALTLTEQPNKIKAHP